MRKTYWVIFCALACQLAFSEAFLRASRYIQIVEPSGKVRYYEFRIYTKTELPLAGHERALSEIEALQGIRNQMLAVQGFYRGRYAAEKRHYIDGKLHLANHSEIVCTREIFPESGKEGELIFLFAKHVGSEGAFETNFQLTLPRGFRPAGNLRTHWLNPTTEPLIRPREPMQYEGDTGVFNAYVLRVSSGRHHKIVGILSYQFAEEAGFFGCGQLCEIDGKRQNIGLSNIAVELYPKGKTPVVEYPGELVLPLRFPKERLAGARGLRILQFNGFSLIPHFSIPELFIKVGFGSVDTFVRQSKRWIENNVAEQPVQWVGATELVYGNIGSRIFHRVSTTERRSPIYQSPAYSEPNLLQIPVVDESGRCNDTPKWLVTGAADTWF